MVMKMGRPPKLASKQERKSEQLNISVSPYIAQQLKKLVSLGYFSNVSDAVRYAITKMITEFEAQGKLKPSKSAEEIAEEIEQKKHKPVKETHAGEEEIR